MEESAWWACQPLSIGTASHEAGPFLLRCYAMTEAHRGLCPLSACATTKPIAARAVGEMDMGIQQQLPTGPGTARAVAWPSTAVTQWQRERIAAAGGNPSVVKETAFRFIRLPEVKQLTGLSRSSLYRMVKNSTLPPPVPLCTDVEPKAAR